ncbi:MAG: hypothetical protein R3C18_00740 [Planctomycetaceae bacterium]
MSRSRLLLRQILAMSLVLFCTASVMAQLTVINRKLGWDNKLRPNTFNQIVIVVQNSGGSAWKGDVSLINREKHDFTLIEPSLFIEPGGERPISFVVFYRNGDDFAIRLKEEGKPAYGMNLEVEGELLPSTDQPAIVQITNTFGVARNASVPLLEPEYFPTSVAGMAGLQAVLIEEVPEFQPAQNAAFLDWVYQGGELHIFDSTGAEPLEFPPALADLNQPFDSYDLGAGRVVRHKEGIGNATKDFVDREIRRVKPKPEKEETDEVQIDSYNYNNYYGSPITALFSPLQRITRPEHNWALIYFLAIVYLLLIFPGGYLLGRFKGDYRITYGAIIGVVLLFSLAFDFVGRRGYGEVTSYNYVAIARPASNGRSQVSQFGNVFVTAGGQYGITHVEENAVFSTGSDLMVSGDDKASNRPLSTLTVDIPAFSDRPVLNTGVVDSSAGSLSVQKLVWGETTVIPDTLILKIDEPDKWPGEIIESRAIFGNRICRMQPNGKDNLVLQRSTEQIHDYYNSNAYRGDYYYGNQGHGNREQLFRQTIAAALAYDMRLFSEEDFEEFELPANRIRIYTMAIGNEAFHVGGDFSPQQDGRVIYVHELTLPMENFTEDNSAEAAAE